ncbi:MAG: hypothetical protein EP330_07485 [Deltaproteobacteria bacterium]|nr:MAG: hypothetical protein EP330_07485 [Deltaproteobacteria bacterium]
MNIYLVPHNWARHVAVGLVVGGAGLLAWWSFLFIALQLGPSLFSIGLFWTSGMEGWWLLSWAATIIGAASVAAELGLRRAPVLQRVGLPLIAGFASFLIAQLFMSTASCVSGVLVSEAMAPLRADGSLVSLRYSLPLWVTAGLSSALGPLAVRRFGGIANHVGAGLICGPLAAATWHWLSYYIFHDLYLATGAALFVWGLIHGLFAWPVPDELYAGWVRVLSDRRFGYRVPIDSPTLPVSERFIGHFPRGLDLFLPVEDGIAELHVSFVRTSDGRYTVRGLSQWPTTVNRFLETIDLRYDPRHPAPLETELSSGDTVLMSDGVHTTVVEFVMLPKEER